jgi:hypothetical protein
MKVGLLAIGHCWSHLLIILIVIFPEAGRNAVGNDSVAAPKWNRPLLQLRRQRELAAPVEEGSRERRGLIPNPFKALLVCLTETLLLSYPSALSTTLLTIASKPPSRSSPRRSTVAMNFKWDYITFRLGQESSSEATSTAS